MAMEEERLSEMLKRAVPEPYLELSAARAMAGQVTARTARHPGRRWMMPTVAGLAATAVAVGVMAGLPSSASPGARPAIPAAAPAVTYRISSATNAVTASYVLDKAAVALDSQAQAGTTWPAGAYWHTESQFTCEGKTYTNNIWIDSDGDGVGWTTGPGQTPGPQPKSGWGCTPVSYTPYSISNPSGISPISIGQKTYTLAELDALPTDPASLLPIVKADETHPFSSTDPGAPTSGQSELIESIWNLLTSNPVPASLRKALYQVCAEIPGITVDGKYTDSLGRTGTVLHVGSWNLVVDTSNGQVLAMNQDSFTDNSGVAPSSVTVNISSGWAAASSVPHVSGGNGS
jgi:hypothetical protein